jgi:hypothetical protein
MARIPKYSLQGAYADSGPFGAEAISLATNYVSANTNCLRGIWVGTTGNIVVDLEGYGTNITFPNVPVGIFYGHFTKVYSTGNGTTASNLVAIW